MTVSHNVVGCGPGRLDRVEALPVPRAIKDLINFEDILSVESGDDPCMDIDDVDDALVQPE